MHTGGFRSLTWITSRVLRHSLSSRSRRSLTARDAVLTLPFALRVVARLNQGCGAPCRTPREWPCVPHTSYSDLDCWRITARRFSGLVTSIQNMVGLLAAHLDVVARQCALLRRARLSTLASARVRFFVDLRVRACGSRIHTGSASPGIFG